MSPRIRANAFGSNFWIFPAGIIPSCWPGLLAPRLLLLLDLLLLQRQPFVAHPRLSLVSREKRHSLVTQLLRHQRPRQYQPPPPSKKRMTMMIRMFSMLIASSLGSCSSPAASRRSAPAPPG